MIPPLILSPLKPKECIELLCPDRRADQLMAEDNDDAIPYCIATGDVKKLVNFFSGRGQLKEALLVAQV